MNLNNINLVLNNPELFLLINKNYLNEGLYLYKKYFISYSIEGYPKYELNNFTFFGVPGDNHCGFHVVLAGLQLFYPKYYENEVKEEVKNIPDLRMKTLALWLEEQNSKIKKQRTTALERDPTDWLQEVDLDVIGKHYGITFITIEIQQEKLFISRGGKDNCEKVIYLVNETNLIDPTKGLSKNELKILKGKDLSDTDLYKNTYIPGTHYDLLLPKEIDELGIYNKNKPFKKTDYYNIRKLNGQSHNDVGRHFSDEKFKITVI